MTTMRITNDMQIVGRLARWLPLPRPDGPPVYAARVPAAPFCEPRNVSGLTQTPYNVEPTLMKGRGGTPVQPAPAPSKIQKRRSRSDTPYQTPAGLWFP